MLQYSDYSHVLTKFFRCAELILVDRLPVYHESFSVDHPKWFKHQKIVRFATIDSPGHIAISQLLTDRDTSTFTAWAYFLDRTDRESLLKGMDAGGIDDFLYKASVMECDYSLIVLAQEVKRFRYQDICYGGMGVNEKLFNVRKVLHRLKTCVDENLAYEEKYQSHPAANNAAGEKILRRDFSRLATRIAHYEESLQWSLNQLMTTMNFRNNVAGFRHMEATSQQTQSMNILSSMASMYVPLTCATGIFGMNLKEINDSPLRLKMFMWVFLGMAMISITFVLVSRQRLRKRRRDASCGEEGESRLEAAAPEEKSTGQVGLIDEKHKGGPFYGRVTRLKSWSFGRFWNRVREARQKDGEV